MSLLATAACAAGVRSSFKLTDTSFAASPGTAPTVYLYPADVPKIAWRSVGIVEVTVPGSAGLTGALDAAVAKGKEVGCTALIEHSVFEHIQSEAWFGGPDGARVRLAHGGSGGSPGGGSASSAPDRPAETTQFDCVLKADDAATTTAIPTRRRHSAG